MIAPFLLGIAATLTFQAYRRRPYGQAFPDFLAMTALQAFGVFR